MGIHDVVAGQTALVAWSGPADPGAPLSEITVQVLDAPGGQIVGLLEVKSDAPDAFGEDDRRRLEECAAMLAPLWG